MRGMLQAIRALVKAFLGNRVSLAAENLSLGHQLSVLQRAVPGPAGSTGSSGPACRGCGVVGSQP